MTIPLIQSQDGFEAVRDAMANILAMESAEQMIRADEWNASHPPEEQVDRNDWDIDVYVERSNPAELFRDDSYRDTQVVNVLYDASNDDNDVSVQTNSVVTSQINIECLAAAVSVETETGHTCGDSNAFKRVHRLSRLVRRILMDPSYRQLGLTSIVWTRKMATRRSYQPTSPAIPSPHVAGILLTFDVKHNEGFDFEALSNAEGALITLRGETDGPIVAQLDYDWTV